MECNNQLSGTVEDICFTATDTGFATGSGTWYTRKTIDGGNNLTITNFSGYEAIDFTSDSVGYLAGANQTIKTSDAGASWVLQNSGVVGINWALIFHSLQQIQVMLLAMVVQLKHLNGGNLVFTQPISIYKSESSIFC